MHSTATASGLTSRLGFQIHFTRLGWGLAVPVVFLLLVGLIAIHATERNAQQQLTADTALTETPAEINWGDRILSWIGPSTLRQGMYIASGVVLMLLTVQIPYQRIGRYAFVIYGLVAFLLLLLVLDRYVDLPMIPVRRNTRRWIDVFGLFSLQPSEFMKPVLILALARYLRYRSSYRSLPGLIPPFLLTLLPMLLILKQPDLGTLLMLLPVLFAMLFVAGARLRHLAAIIFLGVVMMPVFYFGGMKDYQRERIQVVFKQYADDDDWHRNQGFQLRQSKIALGTGGVFGEGYGQGMFIQRSLLPEEHNDFIFAIIGHQFGLVGAVLVILAYALLVFFGIEIATATNDPFGRLLAIGVIVMIVMQALLNMSMNVGLAPITGMTLPFVSFGGSSLWANFIGLGLLINVARRRPMLLSPPAFAYRED
jgi:rod shape determining protein RodA